MELTPLTLNLVNLWPPQVDLAGKLKPGLVVEIIAAIHMWTRYRVIHEIESLIRTTTDERQLAELHQTRCEALTMFYRHAERVTWQ